LKGEELFAFNKAQYGDTIRKYRIKRGLNQPQLANILGVTKNAIPNWEAGRTRPDTNYIPAICDALNISIPTFFGSPTRAADLPIGEQRLLSNYRFLSELNKRAVVNLIDTMIENEDALLRERCESGFERIQRGDLRASAGIGYNLDGGGDCEYAYVRVSREACRADEIIAVSGDSMEPTFRHGDDLFVEHTPAIDPGEIGIFVAAGEGYVKEFQMDGLHSHNPAYPILNFIEDDYVRCIGRVLGVVSKDQYATALELEIMEDIRREKSGQ
jgi:transcriptional regulator with XRE-family HTH domain